MKCVVVGNCQARAIAEFLSELNQDIGKPDIVVIHLAKESERKGHLELFDNADIIFTQKTADNYPITHITSTFLRERYPERTVIWPNAFYVGQTPYLRYVSHVEHGRVLSPLDAYHDLRVLRDWYEDRIGSWPMSWIDVDSLREASLNSLRHREQGCDALISDFISYHEEKRQLFWTFNHPSNMVLLEVAKRMLDHLHIPHSSVRAGLPEKLARIVPPMMGNEKIIGTHIDFGQAAISRPGPTREYTQKEFEELSFMCYDHQAHLLQDMQQLRFTPNS